MRTRTEVQADYNEVCAKLGNLTVQHSQIERLNEELLKRAAELQKEFDAVVAVEAEVAKAAATSAGPTPVPAPPVENVEG